MTLLAFIDLIREDHAFSASVSGCVFWFCLCMAHAVDISIGSRRSGVNFAVTLCALGLSLWGLRRIVDLGIVPLETPLKSAQIDPATGAAGIALATGALLGLAVFFVATLRLLYLWLMDHTPFTIWLVRCAMVVVTLLGVGWVWGEPNVFALSSFGGIFVLYRARALAFRHWI